MKSLLSYYCILYFVRSGILYLFGSLLTVQSSTLAAKRNKRLIDCAVAVPWASTVRCLDVFE